jgi:hypothetical protein
MVLGGGGEVKFFYTISFGKFPLILAKQVEFTLEKPDLILESSYFCQKT